MSPQAPTARHHTHRPLGVLFALLLALVLALSGPFSGAIAIAQPATDDLTTVTGDEIAPFIEEGDDAFTAGLRDDQVDTTLERVSPEELPAYTIEAEFLPEPDEDDHRLIEGSVTFDFVNFTDAEQWALPFRLYANSPADDHDAITMDNVRVNEVDVEPEFTERNSVATVNLETAVQPGESTTIEYDFTSVVPADEVSHYGIYSFDTDTGTWALAHWYPVLAGWDAMHGWEVSPTSTEGDPIFSTTSTYDVSITAPADLVIVATGVTVERTTDDERQTQRFLSGPVRDFTMAANEDFVYSAREVDGTRVISWYLPDQERVGEVMVDYTEQSLELFNELLGPYPYLELEIVPIEMHGAAGAEFPQLFTMADQYYSDTQSLEVPNYVDFTVAHEVVHMWFYLLVGNNQYQHAWMDEGLTNYLSGAIYFNEVYDPMAAEQIVNQQFVQPYERLMARGDQVVDQPTDHFEPTGDYVTAAYAKAPLGFMAIHEEIGDEAFFSALQQYVEDYSYQVATPDDMLEAFQDASEEDISDLWELWFYSDESPDELPSIP